MDILGSESVSTRQAQIAKLAEQSPEMRFTSLNRHLDLEWLKEAYRRTRKDGAVGIDGQTARDYAINLDENLKDLLERAKAGTYYAPPVKRVYIPKGPGSTERRPIGIPTFEDKILQRAVTMILEPIYEHDFREFSFGFRRGRSQHQALEYFRDKIMRVKGGWVLSIDISKFFDTMDKSHLRNFFGQRVRDGVIARLIGKWLNAGVLEGGVVHYPEEGSPQGGVISPQASNVYLHYVIDLWFEKEVKPRLTGAAEIVRFADDCQAVFENKEDAERFHAVLPLRLARYGLKLHPEKTRLLDFRRPPLTRGTSTSAISPGTFDFLGFTLYWGRSRKGNWVIKYKTATDRFSRGLKAITEWCRRHRHQPKRSQHKMLASKLRGHYQYYGLTSNYECLSKFRYQVTRIWRKWLSRRSQKGSISWSSFNDYFHKYPLPFPKIARPAITT